MNRKRTPAENGFTFVEMVMSIAIIGLTMMSVTLIVRSLMVAMNRESGGLRLSMLARRTVQRLDVDLRWTRRLLTELRSDGMVERYRLVLYNGDEVCYALREGRLDRWLQGPDGPKALVTVADRVESFSISARGEEQAEHFSYTIQFAGAKGRPYEATYAPPK